MHGVGTTDQASGRVCDLLRRIVMKHFRSRQREEQEAENEK